MNCKNCGKKLEKVGTVELRCMSKVQKENGKWFVCRNGKCSEYVESS